MRTVLETKPWMDGDRLIGFEVKGEAFLWNQVRRMANALFRLAVGELQESDIAQAIDQPLVPVDFGVAPPQWLVLWGVVEHAPSPKRRTGRSSPRRLPVARLSEPARVAGSRQHNTN